MNRRTRTTVGLVALLAGVVWTIEDTPAQRAATRAVVFVLQRNHRLTVFDAKDLSPLGSFVTGDLGDGLSVRPDGRVVYLLQALTAEWQPPGSHYPGCCSLQALDLETRRMCFVKEPATVNDLPDQPLIDATAAAHALDSLRGRQGAPTRPVVVAAGKRFVAYDRFGMGLIMAPNTIAKASGGAWLLDAGSVMVARRILPEVFFRDLVADSDGRTLYGVEDWPEGKPVRLLRIDAGTGAVVSARSLRPVTGTDVLVDEWSLAYAAVPVSLVPHGEMRLLPCR